MLKGVVALVLAASFSCPAVVSADGQPAEQRIREIVPAWQEFDPVWIKKSGYIFLCGYSERMYSYGDIDTESIMSESFFNIQEVFKGDIKRSDFGINLNQPNRSVVMPRFYLSGRRYLVFLKTTPDAAEKLNDRDIDFYSDNDLGPENITAIIDLSQTKAEKEALLVKAGKSGVHEKFQFTRKKWQALRGDGKIDLDQQKSFIPFIVNVVLEGPADLKKVRSYLGEPDDWYLNADGFSYEYYFNKNACDRTGVVSYNLGIFFALDMRIKSYYIYPYKFVVNSGGNPESYMRRLNDKEMMRLKVFEVDK